MSEETTPPEEENNINELTLEHLSAELEEEHEERALRDDVRLLLVDSRPEIGAPEATGFIGKYAVPLGVGLTAGALTGLIGDGPKTLSGLGVLAGAGLAGGGIIAQQAPRRRLTPTRPYRHGPLNRAPGRITRTPVPGHGTVHIGETNVPLPGGVNRPFVSIWIPPSANSNCAQAGGTYRWYQFVKINFFINNVRKRLRRPIKGATGLTYPFDTWTPDYHDGHPGCVGPDLRPPGLNLPNGVKGKPFKPYGIGGQLTGGGTSLLTGVLDAPDFTVRTNRISPIERLYRRFINQTNVTAQRKPNGWNRTLKVETEVRTHLVCVANGQAQCIGYVAWTYTNEVDIRMDWRNSGAVAGGTAKVWELTSSFTAVRHSVNIAGWTNGC